MKLAVSVGEMMLVQLILSSLLFIFKAIHKALKNALVEGDDSKIVWY